MRDVIELPKKLFGPTGSQEGVYQIKHYKIDDYFFWVVVSVGLGWDHVSVSLNKVVNRKREYVERCPTWEEMCHVKDIFWSKDETVVQFHPAEKDYKNCHPYCLHLWKSLDQPFPVPLPIMVAP